MGPKREHAAKDSVWRALTRTVGAVSDALAVLSAACAGILAVLITVDVAQRWVYGGSVHGLLEVAELLLVAVVFLGLARAETTGAHVRVTLATNRLPEPTRTRLRGCSLLMVAAFTAWMATELTQQAIEAVLTGEYRVGLLRFPLWPARTLVAAGVAALAVVSLLKAITMIFGPSAQQSPINTQDRLDERHHL